MFPTPKRTTNTRCTPCSPGPAPFSRNGQVFPPIHYRRSVEQQPAVHKINGWFVTAAARMFQRAEDCAVLLPNAIGPGKERVRTVRSLFGPGPSSPPPPKHYSPTLKLATDAFYDRGAPHFFLGFLNLGA